jgi:hypothetical protein
MGLGSLIIVGPQELFIQFKEQRKLQYMALKNCFIWISTACIAPYELYPKVGVP